MSPEGATEFFETRLIIAFVNYVISFARFAGSGSFLGTIPGLTPGAITYRAFGAGYLDQLNGAMIFDSKSGFDPSRSSTGYFSPSP